MKESYDEGVKRREDFVNRRIRIGGEWRAAHPEGLSAANLEEFKAFMKRREAEEIKLDRAAQEGGEKK